MPAKIGVITFPGTLDDVDAARAVRYAGAEVVDLWHADSDLHGVDAVVVPGGFSYGDYLRSGAISAQAPVMRSVVDAARDGMPVLGICNGFQILTEAGLLEGALTRNVGLHFHCEDIFLEVASDKTAWTGELTEGEKIHIPAKHGEGRFQAAPETIEKLEKEGQVVFRYTDNFNGSLGDIAGITNEAGNVVGLMPHPEHAIDTLTGPSTDGLKLFTSALATVAGNATATSNA
ncbi:phosphoribosylformylglycinamidine synthase subunit PurQ [Corynebacterium massiliense]|uniref:Phosphoribosylformylglycinamidine synthase subunit PurQ n=1 Tax=Corynebacterium massiliense DSM 45435 TaxID=1121364 RepID=A0ABY7U8Y9_9CORY|nr:phosphoribosylformylglycinamidine synthase subunit PurQ [Corynebacterium massiliense]WCZ33155.1 Phosphoribosylformylglycinamidine synthase 1 [Corynebacterium massiliense DSM 45435]